MTRTVIGLAAVLACAPWVARPNAAFAQEQDIVDVASSADPFSTLVSALQAAELVETLQGDGPFTVFAPTNAAFDKLPEGTLEDLLKPENKDRLTAILTYHVVAGEYPAAQVVTLDGQQVGTVEGSPVTIQVDGDTVMVNNATVTQTDIEASNGVIHVIDTVLLPPEPAPKAQPPVPSKARPSPPAKGKAAPQS